MPAASQLVHVGNLSCFVVGYIYDKEGNLHLNSNSRNINTLGKWGTDHHQDATAHRAITRVRTQDSTC
jgi:hypothetical protein